MSSPNFLLIKVLAANRPAAQNATHKRIPGSLFSDSVSVGVGVVVGGGVDDGLQVAEGEAVEVGLGVGVAVAEGVRVKVGMALAVPVAITAVTVASENSCITL